MIKYAVCLNCRIVIGAFDTDKITYPIHCRDFFEADHGGIPINHFKKRNVAFLDMTALCCGWNPFIGKRIILYINPEDLETTDTSLIDYHLLHEFEITKKYINPDKKDLTAEERQELINREFPDEDLNEGISHIKKNACKYCGKEYQHKSSQSRHESKCAKR